MTTPYSSETTVAKADHPASGRPIRVLHVYKTYLPDTTGGLENALRQITGATTALGVENTIFTLTAGGGPGLLERPEARVRRFRQSFEIASCPFSAAAAVAFRSHARKADLIHYQFPWPFADLLDLLRPSAIPTVVTYQSDVVRQRRLLTLYRPLMNRFLRGADRIIATSPNYAASSEVLQALADKVTVIPLALDESTYPAVSPEKRQAWKNRLGEDFFLFVGVLRYYKGLAFLLDAARGAGYRVVVVGDGPAKAELEVQAHRNGLDNVEFLGFQEEEDKMALLSQCRALVFPSHLRSEAFGMSLLEAAMCGKPMISAEIGTGTTFVNVDGETGLAVPPGDPNALRAAMDRLQGDSALAARMGAAARRRFEQLFTAERLGKLHLSLYREVLGGT